jgi:hypothetical protein
MAQRSFVHKGGSHHDLEIAGVPILGCWLINSRNERFMIGGMIIRASGFPISKLKIHIFVLPTFIFFLFA